jgi:hypothetical protein
MMYLGGMLQLLGVQPTVKEQIKHKEAPSPLSPLNMARPTGLSCWIFVMGKGVLVIRNFGVLIRGLGVGANNPKDVLSFYEAADIK